MYDGVGANHPCVMKPMEHIEYAEHIPHAVGFSPAPSSLVMDLFSPPMTERRRRTIVTYQMDEHATWKQPSEMPAETSTRGSCIEASMHIRASAWRMSMTSCITESYIMRDVMPCTYHAVARHYVPLHGLLLLWMSLSTIVSVHYG